MLKGCVQPQTNGNRVGFPRSRVFPVTSYGLSHPARATEPLPFLAPSATNAEQGTGVNLTITI